MKRLAVLCVLAAVLGLCSQSHGYILVYNVSAQVKAVDTAANTMNRTTVRGTLMVDIDETQGFATEGVLVLFERTGGRQGVYTVSDATGITIYGNSVAAVIDTGWLGSQIILTGSRMQNRNIGLSGRKSVANLMDGSLHLNGGILFDANEVLIGGGMMTAALDLQQTRNANRNSDSVSDVADAVINRLQNRGFTEFVIEEPLPG